MNFTVSEIQKEIERLKEEKDICILAHSYQGREIVEAADFTGDSYKLSVDASKVQNKNIIFCGVHFMAETAKMLSPDKNVYLANTQAGCPMAEQMEPEMIEMIKTQDPERKVVAYINTTAALKTVCDVCVTSSSAVKIVSKMDAQKILFIPDCNLGAFVQKACPDKDIRLLQGGCPVHAAVNVSEVEKAKAAHPNAKLLVHPECIPAVSELADYVGSTSGIVDYAKKSDCKEFIIGTEISIAEHLQYECPDKKFYILSKKILCPNMKMTTLMDVYDLCKAIGTDEAQKNEIIMSDELISKARVCIDEMLRLG
ncbi:MAG: quinolinate synthase NadA [Oscillospiraceae bacterium]